MPIDCRSPEGEAAALIDAAIIALRHAARHLSKQNPQAIVDALRDFYADPEVRQVYVASRDAAFARYSELGAKRRLSAAEKREFKTIQEWLIELPSGRPADDEAMAIIRRAAELLKEQCLRPDEVPEASQDQAVAATRDSAERHQS